MLNKFLIAVLILFTACNNNPFNKSKSDKELLKDMTTYVVKPLIIDTAEGWGGDVKLSIMRESENSGTKVYSVLSSYNGKTLGLDLIVPKVTDREQTFGRGLVIKSIGYESDFFLQTLADVYKQKTDTTLKLVDSISCSFADLNELSRQLSKGKDNNYKSAAHYKLFFEGEGEKNYAEIYLKIDPEKQFVEFREKDEEFRPAIIRFLTRKP